MRIANRMTSLHSAGVVSLMAALAVTGIRVQTAAQSSPEVAGRLIISVGPPIGSSAQIVVEEVFHSSDPASGSKNETIDANGNAVTISWGALGLPDGLSLDLNATTQLMNTAVTAELEVVLEVFVRADAHPTAPHTWFPAYHLNRHDSGEISAVTDGTSFSHAFASFTHWDWMDGRELLHDPLGSTPYFFDDAANCQLGFATQFTGPLAGLDPNVDYLRISHEKLSLDLFASMSPGATAPGVATIDATIDLRIPQWGECGPTTRLTELRGARAAVVGDLSPQQDPHQPARMFLDTTESAGLVGAPGEQSVTFEVELVPPSSASFDAADWAIWWEVYDPDDPASHADVDLSPGGGPDGDDNRDHLPEEVDPLTGFNAYFTSADHKAFGVERSTFPRFGDIAPIGLGLSSLSYDPGTQRWLSTVRFHGTDEGGDNFVVVAGALDIEKAYILHGDASGALSMWRMRYLDKIYMGGYEPTLSPSELARAYSGGPPGVGVQALNANHNAYIEFEFLAQYSLPLQDVLLPSEAAAYIHGQIPNYADGPYRLSLVGVRRIAPPALFSKHYPPGNSDVTPHSLVAVGAMVRNGDKAKIPITCMHELGHLLIGHFVDAVPFHDTGHTPSAACIYYTGSSAQSICPKHVRQLRDSVLVEANPLHNKDLIFGNAAVADSDF